MNGEVLEFFENPIHFVKENVPEVVWDYYLAKVHEEIVALKLTESRANSFRITMRNYAEGLRRAESMFRFHDRLKGVIVKAWDIRNGDFFNGDIENMQIAAKETADKLIAGFEAIYAEQKSNLPKAA